MRVISISLVTVLLSASAAEARVVRLRIETREVVLIIQPPQKNPVTVTFKSSDSSIASVASAREFNNGAAELKVMIQAGTHEGTASIVATLPAFLCGASAELLVEVSKSNGNPQAGNQGGQSQGTAQIKFEPHNLEIKVKDSRIVNLIMSQSFDTQTELTISDSNPASVQAPQTVIIPARDKHVQVMLSGLKEGNALIVATLPAALGGGTASVQVTVRGK